VVTSRDRLGGLMARDGARRLALDLLTPTEAVGLLARVVGRERVAAEPEAVASLVARCAHLPLALRIAGAHLACDAAWSIAGYVDRLDRVGRLAELTMDGDPQAAVRIAFDVSYQELSPHARRLFRLLGLVPGPEFGAEPAAALAAATVPDARRALEELAGAHLVEARTGDRFAFHDLLRLYARERAGREEGPADREAAVERLDGWYVAAADTAARILYPDTLRLPPSGTAAGPEPPVVFGDHADAVAWLDAERANLVATVEAAAEHGPRPMAWRLADALRGYFRLRRFAVDWRAVADAGMAAAVADGDLRAQVAMQLSLGDADQTLGHLSRAIEHYASALELAGQAGWTDGHAAALGNIGNVHWEQGDLRRAGDYQAQTLALYRRTGRQAGQASTLLNLGVVKQVLGELELAVDYGVQALAVFRAMRSRNGEAATLNVLGGVSQELGRTEEAHEHLTSALTLSREVGHRYVEAGTLDDLAGLHRDAGRHAEALRLARSALTLAREIDDRLTEAAALNTLGTIHFAMGDDRAAVDHHRQALTVAKLTGIRVRQAAALLGLAAAEREQGRHAQAATHAEQAMALAVAGGFGVLEGQARTVMAATRLAQGQHDEAARHARSALAVHRRTGHRLGEARTLVILGNALREATGAAVARRCWREALELFSESGWAEAAAVRALLAEDRPRPGDVDASTTA
jgi:tetratricopeptide (TPR) repeat protein